MFALVRLALWSHCGNTGSSKPLTTNNKSAGQTDIMTSQKLRSKIRKTFCYLTSQTQHWQSSLSKSSVFVMHALNMSAHAAVSNTVDCVPYVYTHALVCVHIPRWISKQLVYQQTWPNASLWAKVRVHKHTNGGWWGWTLVINVILTYTKTLFMQINPFMSISNHILAWNSWKSTLWGQTLY